MTASPRTISDGRDSVVRRVTEELREMTPEEQRVAYLLTLNVRRKPVEYVAGSGTIGNFHKSVTEDAVVEAVTVDATAGERKRYEKFQRRWGDRFRHSIIGRSRTAWQMHTCRLPVFERMDKRPNGTRPVPNRLLNTREAMRVVRWFRSLTLTERWDLCRSTRGAGR